MNDPRLDSRRIIASVSGGKDSAAIVARVQAVVDTLTSNDTYNVGRRDALTWLIRELSPKVTP